LTPASVASRSHTVWPATLAAQEDANLLAEALQMWLAGKPLDEVRMWYVRAFRALSVQRGEAFVESIDKFITYYGS